ncbi:hypothetical protein FA13DRAFT_104830 [Coprinellus micaceus]|uniref:GPI inositol-deacylase winged helix domain-containing protein n=1 Tax=Coprinellus micaceus TaxID=71717 RepID=A0A4Y7TI98_COPMI|nr:hypothetical protein FA13DRAFT_104830 [Coprinellus micaceus]
MLDEERDKTLMHLADLPVKLLIFSRPMNIFLERIPTARCIELKANSADVEYFVQESLKSSSRLRTILKGHNELGRTIPSTVSAKCGGMFLIAVLQIEALKRCLNMDARQKTLRSIPSGVSKMYRDTLERINGQTTEEASVAKRVFLWLVYAKRQLAVSELQDALATSYKNSIFSQNAVVNIDIILSICYGLVTVKPTPKVTPRGEPQVTLIHYTTDDFLRDMATQGFSPFADNAIITTLTCTTYLLHHRAGLLNVLKQARGVEYYTHTHTHPADIWLLDKFLASRPFLQYAYQYWGKHARDLELDGGSAHSAVFATIHRFLLTFGELVELESTELLLQVDHDVGTFYTECSFHYAGLFNPAHIAARHVLASLWPLVKRYGWELMRGKLRWSALHFAAYHNEVEMVKRLLLDLPASIINSRDMDNRTALAVAVSRSNDDVVRVLLAHHAATVDVVALGTAVRAGDEAVVTLLLPKVPDPAVSTAGIN